MDVKEIVICRFCLKIPKAVHVIDDTFKEMLDILLLNLGWNFDDYAVICRSCASISKKLCNFKLTCIKSEIEYVTTCDKKQGFVERDINVCPLCQDSINGNDSVSLEVLFNEPIMEKLLPAFMPEIGQLYKFSLNHKLELNFSFALNVHCINDGDLQLKFNYQLEDVAPVKLQAMAFDSAKKSTICKSCQENLEIYSKLIQKYLATEEKINNFLWTGLYTNCTTQMLLTSIHMYSSEPIAAIDAVDIPIYRCNLGGYKTSNKEHKTNAVHKATSQMKTYKCTLCAYETKLLSHLRRHTIVHKDNSEVTIFKCVLCPFETKWKHCMRSHQYTHDKNLGGYPPKMYKCTVCSFETHRKDSLENHSLIHKDKSSLRMYKCQSCTFETKWKHSFTKHQITHKISNSTTVTDSNGTVYKCMSCTYETGSKKDMSQHSVVHKDQIKVKTYTCTVCSFETYRKDCLESHSMIHKDKSSLQMYKCQSCTFETKWKPSFMKHQITHKITNSTTVTDSNGTTYKCMSCTYETGSKKDMSQHSVIHKDQIQVKMYRCEGCAYETYEKYQLVRHCRSRKCINNGQESHKEQNYL